MKKFLAALLASVMTLCCAAALAEDTGLADVQAKGTFVMGFDEEYPPMGFVDEKGDHVGFDIDLAKEVTSRLGVELVLQPIAWDSKELELSGKNIDCIWSGLTMTPERIEQLTFSIPYLANEQILVVRTDSGITSKDELAGKVLGTQAGSSSVDVLNANPDLKDSVAEVALYDDFVAALMDLKLGGIDVLLIDSVVGNYYIRMTRRSSPFCRKSWTLRNTASPSARARIRSRTPSAKRSSPWLRTARSTPSAPTGSQTTSRWFPSTPRITRNKTRENDWAAARRPFRTIPLSSFNS